MGHTLQKPSVQAGSKAFMRARREMSESPREQTALGELTQTYDYSKDNHHHFGVLAAPDTLIRL